MNLRKYLVLLAVMCSSACGDVLLARGMKDLGPIKLQHPLSLIAALANPWVFLGIICLIGFFVSYMTALSWADLTYVLPATAFGYVLLALLSKYFLHEHLSPYRWLGVILISCGVGWVTRGPELTRHNQPEARSTKTSESEAPALHATVSASTSANSAAIADGNSGANNTAGIDATVSAGNLDAGKSAPQASRVRAAEGRS